MLVRAATRAFPPLPESRESRQEGLYGGAAHCPGKPLVL
jgi:hypothetical protein